MPIFPATDHDDSQERSRRQMFSVADRSGQRRLTEVVVGTSHVKSLPYLAVPVLHFELAIRTSEYRRPPGRIFRTDQAVRERTSADRPVDARSPEAWAGPVPICPPSAVVAVPVPGDRDEGVPE